MLYGAYLLVEDRAFPKHLAKHDLKKKTICSPFDFFLNKTPTTTWLS